MLGCYNSIVDLKVLSAIINCTVFLCLHRLCNECHRILKLFERYGKFVKNGPKKSSFWNFWAFFAINSHFSNPFQPKSSIFALRADHHPRFIKLRRIAVNL